MRCLAFGAFWRTCGAAGARPDSIVHKLRVLALSAPDGGLPRAYPRSRAGPPQHALPAREHAPAPSVGRFSLGGACAVDAKVGLSVCTEQTAFVCRSTTSRTRRMRCTPRRSSSRSSCRTTAEGRRARSTSTAVRACHVCTATGLTPPLSPWHFVWVLTCAALFCVQMCACARAGVCTLVCVQGTGGPAHCGW
jgi:hypothetical protein